MWWWNASVYAPRSERSSPAFEKVCSVALKL